MSNLEDAFEQAQAEVGYEDDQDIKVWSKSDDDEVVEEESTEEESVEEVEETATKPETEEESSDESFTNIDPNELPDELKGVYKSLQADYTRKTQKAAEERKKAQEEIEQMKSQLEQLQQGNQAPEQTQKTQEELLKDLVDKQIAQKELKQFEQEAKSYYENADPRLKSGSDSYDESTDRVVGQMMDDKLNQYYEENGTELGFDYKSALKESLKSWDQYLEQQTNKRIEKQTKLAKEKQKQVSKNNPKTRSGSARPVVKTLDDALELAMRS